ncbi:MAG: FtsX-like permease family protein [Christensenellaceae bacterium]|jgi:ABC-type antimicrobial peptide transport system permease subunit
MFRIATEFIWEKRRTSFLFAAIVAIALALMLLIIPLFDTIITNLNAANFNRYGTQHLTLFDVSEEEVEALLADAPLQAEAQGWLYNYGNWNIASTKNTLTIGAFTEEALTIGQLEVLEGRMPRAENEIAIEQTALYRVSETAHIGTTVRLEKEGLQKSYRVVGILGDYSKRWNTPMGNYKAGYTDLPQGITIQNSVMQQTAVADCLLVFEKHPFESDGFFNYMYETIHGTLNYAYNENAMNGEYLNVVAPFEAFRDMFILVLLLGICITIGATLIYYVTSYKRAYHTLFTLGAEGEYPFYLYLLQNICIMCFAILGGALLAMLLGTVVSMFTGEVKIQIFHRNSMLWPVLMLLATFLLALCAYQFLIRPLRGQSTSKTKGAKKARHMRLHRSFLFSLWKTFIRQNTKRIVISLFMIGLLVAAISVSIPYVKDLTSLGTVMDEPGMPDFSVHGTMGGGSYGRFVLPYADRYRVMPAAEVMEIEEIEGVQLVRASYYAQDAGLIIEQKTPYWEEVTKPMVSYLEDGTIEEYEDPTAAYRFAGEPGEDVLIAWNGIGKVVATEAVMESLQEAYPELVGIELKENEAICFFPKTWEGEKEEDLYNAGDTLRFGYLSYEVSQTEAYDDPSKITYHEATLNAAAVVRVPFYLKGEDLEYGSPEYGDITFLVSAETVENNPMFTGIQEFDVYLEKDIAPGPYTEAKVKTIQTAFTIPDALITIWADEALQNQILAEAIQSSITMLFVVFGLFAVISIYMVIYLSLLQRQKSLAIYRSLGMRKHTLFFAIYFELLFYWVLVMLLAFLLCVPASMHVHLWSAFWDKQMLQPVLPIVAKIALIGIPLCAIIAWTLLRRVYKNSIYAAIRHET